MGELITDDILEPSRSPPPRGHLGRPHARYGDLVDRLSFYAPYQSDPDRWKRVLAGFADRRRLGHDPRGGRRPGRTLPSRRRARSIGEAVAAGDARPCRRAPPPCRARQGDVERVRRGNPKVGPIRSAIVLASGVTITNGQWHLQLDGLQPDPAASRTQPIFSSTRPRSPRRERPSEPARAECHVEAHHVGLARGRATGSDGRHLRW